MGHFAGELSSTDLLGRGPAGAGPASPFRFAVELEALVPVYDMHAAMRSRTMDWEMGDLHHEQGLRATGSLDALGRSWPIDGVAIRDHSRGERHFGRFGGHVWLNTIWPRSRRPVTSSSPSTTSARCSRTSVRAQPVRFWTR